MSDMNRVTLVGRLTRDAEVRYTGSGMPIVGLRLAFSTRQKNPSTGQWDEKSNFVDVSLFGDRFERLASHLEKGRRVGIDGRLEFREWESNGQKRSTIEVIANDMQFLDSRGEGGGEMGGQRQYGGQAGSSAGGGNVTPDTSDFVPVGGGAADDDDIPF